eukprot:991376_1
MMRRLANRYILRAYWCILFSIANLLHACTVHTTTGPTVHHEFIAIMKSDAALHNLRSTMAAAPSNSSAAPLHCTIPFVLHLTGVCGAELDAIIGEMGEHMESVFPNSIFEQHQLITKEAKSWGLDRIDQPRFLDGSYSVPEANFSDVEVYIVDTGVASDHEEFLPDQVRHLSCLGSVCRHRDSGIDFTGHGTHVAGIAGSLRYGVAPGVPITDVQVLEADGQGRLTSLILGLGFIYHECVNSGKKCIVNLSLGYTSVDELADSVVQSLTDAGILVVISAGNKAIDACGASPARVQSALTAGSMDVSDHRSQFSNFGPCVDVFAPGTNILSVGSAGGTRYLSGTSMAAPHVSGTAALLLAGRPELLITEIHSLIRQSAVDMLRGAPPNTTRGILQVSGAKHVSRNQDKIEG